MVLRYSAGKFAKVFCATIIATAVCFGSSASGAAEDSKAPAVQEIVYTKAGSAELKLDLMSPTDGDGPFPAVFLIHGGAWRAGNKSDVRPLMPEFVRHGYVAISPQYRFCPKETFPAQVHDVKAAVRWIKTNAKKYRIDPARIGAIGFSAGGHLALMLGVTSPATDSREKLKARPRRVTAASRQWSTTSGRPTWPPTTYLISRSLWSKTFWAEPPRPSPKQRGKHRH